LTTLFITRFQSLMPQLGYWSLFLTYVVLVTYLNGQRDQVLLLAWLTFALVNRSLFCEWLKKKRLIIKRGKLASEISLWRVAKRNRTSLTGHSSISEGAKLHNLSFSFRRLDQISEISDIYLVLMNSLLLRRLESAMDKAEGIGYTETGRESPFALCVPFQRQCRGYRSLVWIP